MTIGRQYETSDQQTSDGFQPSDQYRASDEFPTTDEGQFRSEDDASIFPRNADSSDEVRNDELRNDEDPSQTSVFEPVGSSEDGTPELTNDDALGESRDDSRDESHADALGESRDDSLDETRGQWETPAATTGANDFSTGLPADTRVVETPVVDEGARTPEHALDDRWSALQGAFVDDPDTAVKDAAALVDDAMQKLLQNLQSEQSGESSTEQKRLAFQRYRAVHEVLTRV